MTVRDQIKIRIEKLPENLLPELLDFIQFLETRRDQAALSNASQVLSSATFARIWNNEEDAAYDRP